MVDMVMAERMAAYRQPPSEGGAVRGATPARRPLQGTGMQLTRLFKHLLGSYSRLRVSEVE